MSNPIPEVRLATAVMGMRWAQAQRDARMRSLIFHSRLKLQQPLPYEGADWLRAASVRLMTAGAHLVAYGLPPNRSARKHQRLAYC